MTKGELERRVREAGCAAGEPSLPACRCTPSDKCTWCFAAESPPKWDGAAYVWTLVDGGTRRGRCYHPNGATGLCRGCLPPNHGNRCAGPAVGFYACLCARCLYERGEGPKPPPVLGVDLATAKADPTPAPTSCLGRHDDRPCALPGGHDVGCRAACHECKGTGRRVYNYGEPKEFECRRCCGTKLEHPFGRHARSDVVYALDVSSWQLASLDDVPELVGDTAELVCTTPGYNGVVQLPEAAGCVAKGTPVVGILGAPAGFTGLRAWLPTTDPAEGEFFAINRSPRPAWPSSATALSARELIEHGLETELHRGLYGETNRPSVDEPLEGACAAPKGDPYVEARIVYLTPPGEVPIGATWPQATLRARAEVARLRAEEAEAREAAEHLEAMLAEHGEPAALKADMPTCDVCGALSPYESWADARTAGWSQGTGADGEGVTTCSDACELEAFGASDEEW